MFNHQVMPEHDANFGSNPMYHRYDLKHFVKTFVTRSTQLFGAKGIFCLYRGGMLIGADSKSLLKKLAHSGYHYSH